MILPYLSGEISMIFRSLIFVLVTAVVANLGIVGTAAAQDRFEFSVFPGYKVINSDEISAVAEVSQTDWSVGGSMAARFRINNRPFQYEVGFSYGKSTVLEQVDPFNLSLSNAVDLRYRTLPQEIFYIHNVSDRIELLTGVNVTAQDRTVMHSNLDIKDDRLFSMGIGLSGKIRMILNRFDSGNGLVFMNLSARWTEFIYHDEKSRDLSDFTLRHLTLSPQIGVSYNMN
jgi:hypothetical protein